ncbi:MULTISPECIES: autotransporter assembly complex protein TamA [Giesbergeria]|uniref:Autotransporter assembly complex family protein n=1 Tax=Giesbergeria sinuosa TaxID=80883 RepID=A0ABV9QEP7_9BURK
MWGLLRGLAPVGRWVLLGVVLCAVAGCSGLPVRNQEQHNQDAPSQSSAVSEVEAFTLQVRSPNEEVAAYLEKHLELQRFRTLPELQEREWLRLLAAVPEDARELLATLGYFAPTIAVERTLAPHADAQALPQITLTVEPGAATQIAQVQIDFVGAVAQAEPASPQIAQIRQSWNLAPGQLFTQAAWDGAKALGLRSLQARHYPAARIAHSHALIDADQHRADLSVRYDSGPAYRFGTLQLHGQQRYDPEGARRIARLPMGASYDQAQLLEAQQRLASSGYYDTVFLRLDTDTATPEAAPVVAQVREAQLQKWVFGLGVSTDSGARLRIDHTHNRLPGLGWRAVSKLSLDQQTKLLATQWMDLPNEQGWRWFGGGQVQREVTGSYQVNSARLQAGQRRDSERIDRSNYLQYDYAHAQGTAAPPSSTALSANHSWTGRYFDSTTAPAAGYGLAWELGVGMTLHPQRDPFVRLLGRWLAFVPSQAVTLPSGRSRQSRWALRAEGGAVLAREGASLPVTQLFLTGGDTTVRGYGYHQIGARTVLHQLYGGRYLAVTSVEWQRPIVLNGQFSDWESTLFADAGAVGDTPRAMRLRTSVGAGVRWRSPVGPLQADVAYGVQDQSVRLHLRLGFSF